MQKVLIVIIWQLFRHFLLFYNQVHNINIWEKIGWSR